MHGLMIILLFLLQLKLKDETSGQEYELEAGVGIQVEQYTDFWRELPVRSSDDQLQGIVTLTISTYKGKSFQDYFLNSGF